MAFGSFTQASPTSSISPYSKHLFSSPQADGWMRVERGRGIKLRNWACPPRPGLAMRWLHLGTHDPILDEAQDQNRGEHSTKMGGGVYSESGCGVGWGDSLGLSARQSFQPWSSWSFPRGCPPKARQPCAWTDPGHQCSQQGSAGTARDPLRT